MKRRAFFGGLASLIAAPVAIKAAEAMSELPAIESPPTFDKVYSQDYCASSSIVAYVSTDLVYTPVLACTAVADVRPKLRKR